MIDSALEDFGKIYEEVFTEEAGICMRFKNFYEETFGKLFKPYVCKAPTVDKEIIEAKDI